MPSTTPLRDYLDSAGQSAEAFAAQHGFSPWSVRHWARGNKHPNLDAQIRLSAATGGKVSPERWLKWSLRRPAAEQAA